MQYEGKLIKTFPGTLGEYQEIVSMAVESSSVQPVPGVVEVRGNWFFFFFSIFPRPTQVCFLTSAIPVWKLLATDLSSGHAIEQQASG